MFLALSCAPMRMNFGQYSLIKLKKWAILPGILCTCRKIVSMGGMQYFDSFDCWKVFDFDYLHHIELCNMLPLLYLTIRKEKNLSQAQPLLYIFVSGCTSYCPTVRNSTWLPSLSSSSSQTFKQSRCLHYLQSSLAFTLKIQEYS